MLLPIIVTVSLSASPSVQKEETFEDWANKPHEKFDVGARAFEAARRELLEQYVKNDLNEDDLYRAAVQGMLTNIDPAMRAHNRLLGPAEFAEMNADLKAEIVGVGLMLKFDNATGRADVLGVIPGSPAARSDIKAGDVLLTVDGQSFKGKQMRDLIYAVRGKAGDKVTLNLLHDATVVTRTLERQKVAYDVVTEEALPGDVAVLHVWAFAETTPQSMRAALGRIAARNPKALIVDLRDNPGGMLDGAVEATRMLLPRGKTVVKLVKRGGKEETLTATAEPVLKPVPTVVLINEHTGSSAELMAAALREGLKAPLIGTKSLGKWSVQSLKELPNHFVMRYTVAHFFAPDGNTYEGTGLLPDIEVAFDEDARSKMPRDGAIEDKLKADPQLKAAASFLRLR
jgi:carboxyl-terminal processing protease